MLRMFMAGTSVVRSPAVGLSTKFGFHTPTTTIGMVLCPGCSEDFGMYEVDTDNDQEQTGTDEINPSDDAAITQATKNFRSACWKEFDPIMVDGVAEKGRCKHCDALIGAKRGASALLTHLKRCKKRCRALRIVQDLSSTLRSLNGTRLKDWNYDPDLSRQELMRMISLHEVPFLFVEYDGFRRFIASLNPLFGVPCRTTSRNGCMKDFLEKKSELREIFKSSDCRFSLTADMWTSNQTLGYICVTCHFIDKEWKLKKRIIKYIDVSTAHTGAELFSNILNCIRDWCMEDKLLGITLDNATSNDAMVGMLKRNLVDKKLLPVNGKILHHRCAGHVINLIVKDGLQLVEPIVTNIRESVKYIRSSPSRRQMFKEIIAQEGIKCKRRPSLDAVTRWNSTCSILHTTIEFRKAFELLKSQDQKYTYAPFAEEWARAVVLCMLLQEFKDATKLISGSHYPTSNLYFHQIWKIKLTLAEEVTKVGLELAPTIKALNLDLADLRGGARGGARGEEVAEERRKRQRPAGSRGKRPERWKPGRWHLNRRRRRPSMLGQEGDRLDPGFDPIAPDSFGVDPLRSMAQNEGQTGITSGPIRTPFRPRISPSYARRRESSSAAVPKNKPPMCKW